MSGNQLLRFLVSFLLFLTTGLRAQTTLYPGDIAVLAVANDVGGCGLNPNSDLVSFVCFQDITAGTTIHVTDNGWETANAGEWGDSEGVLTITRTGPTVAAGTVITIEANSTLLGWLYSINNYAPGWTIAQTNTPGGPFNLEPGGDQIYFMQDGTWDNHGGGGDDATYDGGRIIYGFNTLTTWNADGSTHQSNIHPDLDACFHFEGNGSNFYKYVNPLTPEYGFIWVKRIDDPANWVSPPDCFTWDNTAPNYAGGYTIPINAAPFGVYCPTICEQCPPYDAAMSFDLPPGYTFDLVYSNGTDTYEVFGVMDGDWQFHTITQDVTYFLVSVTEVNGCPIAPHFSSEASYMAPYMYPGMHKTLWICADDDTPINLPYFLGGAPGGQWTPTISFDTYWYNDFGEGVFLYSHKYYDPACDPDTASIKIIFPNLEGTIADVTCDQNGTPNYIFDDLIIVTLTVTGNHFGPIGSEYNIYVSEGTITPTVGQVGVPTVFTLSPGTALSTDDIILSIENINPAPGINIGTCTMDFPITPPGFCSDPCDYSMEASLDGFGEICPNECPDNPVYAELAVSGGTPPYEMSFNITAPGYPTWTFTEVPVTEYQEFTICVGNVPAPVFDPSNFQITLPVALAGSEATIVINQVIDYYNCTAILDINEAIVGVYTLPAVDTFDFSVCRSAAGSFDLTQYDEEISLWLDVTWYDGDPLTVGELIPNPNVADLNNVVQLWALVEDDYCRNSIQVPFIILPSPNIDSIPPVEVCEGSPVVLQSIPIVDLWASNATYSFHSGMPFDSSTLIDPMYYLPVDSVTVFLHSTAGMCHDTTPIDINLQPYPGFTLDATPCQMAANTWSILFTTDADSIHASVGTVTNNPAGQDMITNIPENTNVTIEILNPSGMCRDTFLIVAPNCDCPAISAPAPGQASYEVCDDAAIPTLSVSVDVGLQANWYDVPSGGVALLQNSLTFQPATLSSATYYAEAYNPADNCTSLRTPVPLVVHPSAQLQQVADPVVCEPNTINLDALAPVVLNGVGGTGGWFNLSNNQPASGTVMPANGQSWYYVFTSNPGSCISRDTISAVVNPLPALNVFEIICDDQTLTYDISFTTEAELVAANTGSLTQVGATDTFTISNVAFNTDIQIYLEITSTGCSVNITQTAPDCSCPPLLQQTSLAACSASGNIDLTAFEGPGVNGTWQMVSTPAGGNPAVLAGSTLQVNGSDPGAYVLRFVRSVILDDCVDSALFNLSLSTSPFADAGTDGTSCAPDQIVLSGTAGGSNVQFGWQTTGAGMIGSPNTLNTTYTPVIADYSAGTISFTLTATDQTGLCPAASETIDITIDASAYYTLSAGPGVYCDTSDVSVDLDAFITYGTTNGHWFFPAPVTAPITSNSFFTPSDLTAGNYTVYYTTTNAVAPCENDTTGLMLIIQNCECPSVALTNPTDRLCSDAGTQDLDDYLITTEPGMWSIALAPAGSNPAVINGSVFTTNQSDPGQYTLRYTLSNPVAGCDDYAEITLEVIETPAIQYQAAQCAGDLLSWEVIVISDAENVTTSTGVINALGNNRYEVTAITANADLTVTASNAAGLCTSSINIPAPDCDCDLSISGLPDNEALCPGDQITLTGNVTGGKGDITSFWIVSNDSLYQNSIQVGQAGTYTFVSKDSLGCEQQHQVIVTVYSPMVADLTSTDVTCPGDVDGSIILFGIQGGTSPFLVSVNNGPVQSVSAFPLEFNNLAAGSYTIEITDASNCIITETVTVNAASGESLTLGPDQTILVGDSALISAVLSFTPTEFTWTGDTSEINTSQLSNWIRPEENVDLTLTAIDAKGCVYTDNIQVRVLLTSAIMVPNVFSPNGDGINDVLAPSADPSITAIDYFEIYSRWGELVFEVRDALPDQPGLGWDGRFHEELMNPGVYLYRLGARNKRGQEFFLYGDITLVR